MAEEAIRNLRFDDVRGNHLLIALSGGADSIALLTLLHQFQSQYALKLTCAHFHHGIRGPEADRDAAFCRSFCQSLGVELIEGCGDVPAYAREHSAGLETAAREMRYAFLRETARNTGADKIALAHHLNDQAETILMHLLRGSGLTGMQGMARLQDDLYRPLLEIPKDDLVQYLRKRGISWQEDITNSVDDNPRNALRLNVLPEIEKSYPSAAKAIARFGSIARSEEAFLCRITNQFLSKRRQTGPYGQRLLLDGNEDEALLRRCIRAMAGQQLSMEKTNAILVLAQSPRGRLEISSNLLVEKTSSALYFLHPEKEKPAAIPLQIPGRTTLKGVCHILAEVGTFPIEADQPLTECFSHESLTGACLRLRLSGDRIHPLGAKGSRLLSDYLIDKKIDRPLRDCMPVIAKEKNILWAGGAGISHEARIQNETERMVRLTIIPITDEKAEVPI